MLKHVNSAHDTAMTFMRCVQQPEDGSDDDETGGSEKHATETNRSGITEENIATDAAPEKDEQPAESQKSKSDAKILGLKTFEEQPSDNETGGSEKHTKETNNSEITEENIATD